MFSIIHTPTEGEAIQNFSQLFPRPEGCFLNIDDQDCVEDNLAQWGGPKDVDYIVVTDGEEVTMRSSRSSCSILIRTQILGIGDQGTHRRNM